MEPWQERTCMLIGEEGLERLTSARVAVVGAGGVGAYAAEMLARSGVGHIGIVDSDTVSESNINRQLLALHSTIGRPKVEVLRERILDINPSADVCIVDEFLTEDNARVILERIFGPADARAADAICVIDAIDTLSPKVALAAYCVAAGIPLVSSMGSGGKTDATQVRVVDISKTYECPLARMMRGRLRKLGIHKGIQAVFSPEIPDRTGMVIEETRNKKSQVGTISYLPAVFGCVCAQAAIRRIAGIG